MINGNNTLDIGVFAPSADQYHRARKLAEKLGIPIVDDNNGEFKLLLICSSEGLALQQTGRNSPGPIRVSFTNPSMAYRMKHGGGRSQALARAVGLKKGLHPVVIDATAGLGRDGFILAQLGCRVHMLERSPILAAMLEDGLQRAGQNEMTAEAVKRIRLTPADSYDFLQKQKEQERPDVIYLDPMYPERSKSSLVKKEMRILRLVAGDDPDAGRLLETAIACARNRVVVKRPRLAPALGNTVVSHAIKGKTSRFDVYLT